MRRFIVLIDTLYDNRVRVVISSDVSLDNLFTHIDESTDKEITDEQRMLLDDLKLDHKSVRAFLKNL